jgi:hypothetical protein
MKKGQKNMKKLMGVLLTGLVVVVFLFPTSAGATTIDVEAANLNGGTALPSYRAGDTLVVYGSEQLNTDGWAALKNAPLQYELVLNNGQTSIPAGDIAAAFPNLLSLTAETVTQVGKMAFMGSAVLRSVSLPTAASIAESAFSACSELKEVSLPKVSALGANVFAGCSRLEAVSLPAVTEVPSRAFANCSMLASLSLPVAKKIGQSAFDSCSALTTLSLPAVTEIDLRAFYGAASVTEISMPHVVTIGNEAFSGCAALKILHLENADPSVAENAFSGVSSVTIYSNRKTLTDKDYPPYHLANPKDPEKDSGGGCNTGIGLGLGLASLAMFCLSKRRSL